MEGGPLRDEGAGHYSPRSGEAAAGDPGPGRLEEGQDPLPFSAGLLVKQKSPEALNLRAFSVRIGVVLFIYAHLGPCN